MDSREIVSGFKIKIGRHRTTFTTCENMVLQATKQGRIIRQTSKSAKILFVFIITHRLSADSIAYLVGVVKRFCGKKNEKSHQNSKDFILK